jgi:hypothetical protein
MRELIVAMLLPFIVFYCSRISYGWRQQWLQWLQHQIFVSVCDSVRLL